MSFCGFTFGGGGNTYSAEPATISLTAPEAKLVAGSPTSPVNLAFAWEMPHINTAEPIELSEATVSVTSKATNAKLVSGHIVLQTIGDQIVHGSFDLSTKSSDGRIFPVVGSFTAKLEK